MSQELWVGLIVGLAALYLVWRWLPAGWRQRLGIRPSRAKGASDCATCSGCSGGGCAPPGDRTDIQTGNGGKPTLARARWQPSLPSSNSRQGEGRHS